MSTFREWIKEMESKPENAISDGGFPVNMEILRLQAKYYGVSDSELDEMLKTVPKQEAK
jgi:hypothetical protein